MNAHPQTPDYVCELCRCLHDRANVRAGAVRPTEALQDLARVERSAEALKPLNRHTLRMGLLDSRARLLGAPFSPVHDASAAQAAAAQMRFEIADASNLWMCGLGKMRLAQHQHDWGK